MSDSTVDAAFRSLGKTLEINRLERTLEEMRLALRWYAAFVAGCRKVSSEGDLARRELDKDGGRRAREALGEQEVLPCLVVQHGDHARCGHCDLVWDVNDPAPPACKAGQ